jgi:hypothetical protein
MRKPKQVPCPERLRLVPQQFSWIDQSLVQHGLIDRMSAHAAALYLFLVTVADAQGLSYYGGATLVRRLRLSEQALTEVRGELVALGLIAYQAPLYQVLSIGDPVPHRAPRMGPSATASDTASAPPPPARRPHAAPVSLAQLLELERSHARL